MPAPDIPWIISRSVIKTDKFLRTSSRSDPLQPQFPLLWSLSQVLACLIISGRSRKPWVGAVLSGQWWPPAHSNTISPCPKVAAGYGYPKCHVLTLVSGANPQTHCGKIWLVSESGALTIQGLQNRQVGFNSFGQAFPSIGTLIGLRS